MIFKSKIIFFLLLSLVFSFLLTSVASAFSFSGFGEPLKPYKKEDKQGKEQTYNWRISLEVGGTWALAAGHLGEDFVLRAKKDVDGNDIGRAEIGEPVYSIADGIVFQVADWPECGVGNHGWGGVVLIKHQIPEDENKTFNLTGTILPDPKAKDKKAEKERIKKLEEKGTKTVYSMYGHLKNIKVKKGQSIKKGDKMGELGDVCYRNSPKKYSPHLHFEFKSQEAINGKSNKDVEIDDILGIGHGYSYTTGFAPNRYIPSKFIENNKDLIIKEKSITQRIGKTAAAIIALPEGIIGEEENLSFWDKTKFYWNGFWANAGELFGVEKIKDTETEKQAEDEKEKEDEKKEIASPALPSPKDKEKKTEDSPPLVEMEIWSQKFSGKEVLSFTVIAKEEKIVKTVIMQFKNTGNTVWKKDSAKGEDELKKGMVSLNIVHDSGETAARFYYENWITKRRPCSFKEKEVKPGELATFEFTIAFPQKLGKYYPQFRPVYFNGENFNWIGGDKGIFVAEVRKGSSGLEFAAADIAKVAEEVLEDEKKEEEKKETEKESENENSESETEPEENLKPKIVFKDIASPQNALSFKIEWEVENGISDGKYNFGLWNYENQKCEAAEETSQAEYVFKGENEKKYIFCAQAIYEDGNFGEWIKTEEIEIFLSLSLVSPCNNFKIRDKDIKEFIFEWEALDSANNYIFEISGKDNFEEPLILRKENLTGLSYSLTADEKNVLSVGAYLWRVGGEAGNNGEDKIIWSESRPFFIQGWMIEVVDDEKVKLPYNGIEVGVGWHTSLALDDKGNPGITYANWTHGRKVFYTYFNGEKWERKMLEPGCLISSFSSGPTSLDFDNNGNPGILYKTYVPMGVRSQGKSGLIYAYCDRSKGSCFGQNNNSWQYSIVTEDRVGRYFSLAFDKNGSPIAAYVDDRNDILKYAVFDKEKEKWEIETVGESSGIFAFAIDGDGKPAFAYIGDANSKTEKGKEILYASLKYSSKNEEGKWEEKIIKEESSYNTSIGKISLAFDSEGNAGVSYNLVEENFSSLEYAYYNNYVWQTETVDKNIIAIYSSLDFGSQDRPAIAYLVAYVDQETKTSKEKLKYAYFNGEEWQAETVDGSEDKIGRYCSLAIDSFSNPAISYFDAINQTLKFAKFKSW